MLLTLSLSYSLAVRNADLKYFSSFFSSYTSLLFLIRSGYLAFFCFNNNKYAINLFAFTLIHLGYTSAEGHSSMKRIDHYSIGEFSTIKEIGYISMRGWNSRDCTSRETGFTKARIDYSSREEGGCAYSMISYLEEKVALV